MNDIFVLTDSGENFRLENGVVYGLVKNRAVKFYFDGRKLLKSVTHFGGMDYTLHDGKKLIALNKTFYIKE